MKEGTPNWMTGRWAAVLFSALSLLAGIVVPGLYVSFVIAVEEKLPGLLQHSPILDYLFIGLAGLIFVGSIIALVRFGKRTKQKRLLYAAFFVLGIVLSPLILMNVCLSLIVLLIAIFGGGRIT